jgi:BirA family biotin operon repressor/biotin-[acetyl-CoA-carboxylase] ligase
VLLRQAKDGAVEGAWALARRQTGGKGRQGRAWTSIAGNLHASTMVRLRDGDPAPATLSLVCAVALHRAFVEITDIPSHALRIKWPNDLIACRGDAWGKVAGILLEREGEVIVAGFGANLAEAPRLPDRAVYSVADFGSAPDPRSFCFALGASFAEELERWRSRGPADTRRRWLDRATPVGTPLTVHVAANESKTGTFAGLEPDGALRLQTPPGIEIVRAGDVSLF